MRLAERISRALPQLWFAITIGLTLIAPNAARAAEKLALGYGSADALYGPWFYAQEKGYFQKHGLDTTLAFLDSGMKAVQAMVGNSIEVCACDSTGTITAHLAGADIRFIGVTLGVLTGNVYTAKGIKSPAELKGKKWAISSFGSEAHTSALLAIKSFGLSNQDVTMVQVGNQGNRFAALESGQVQATTFLPPISAKAEQSGYPKIAEMPKLAPNAFSVGPAVLMKTLKERRAVVKAFLMALVEATAAYKKDREGGVAVLQKQLKIANRKDAELAWDYYTPLYPADFRPTESSLQFHLDRAGEPNAKTTKPQDLVELSLLGELEQEGFFKSLR